MTDPDDNLSDYHASLNRRSLFLLGCATACATGAVLCFIRLVVNLFY